MFADHESNPVAEQRVVEYLKRHKYDKNKFIAEAEKAEREGKSREKTMPDVEEGDIDEYLLKRAENELRKAQNRVDALRQQLAEKKTKSG